MKYLHTMVRVSDLEASLDFYCNKLGLEEVGRHEVPPGRFTLVFLAAPGAVENIYQICQRLMQAGVTINRPPRDGHMAFVRSPDNISIELLQRGDALPPEEPWASMPNAGEW